jgi:hypothetical protein
MQTRSCLLGSIMGRVEPKGVGCKVYWHRGDMGEDSDIVVVVVLGTLGVNGR